MKQRPTPFGLRMPDELRNAVRNIAEREGRSMNNQIVRVLKTAVEADQSAPGQP